MKKQQNYKNHIRFNPLHHFVIAPLTGTLFIWSLVSLFLASEINSQHVYMVLLSLGLFLTTFSARLHGLRNQDRLIRVEMRQRYFELTGKRFSEKESQLRISQIIALRFASDEELLDLLDRAVKDHLSAKRIKEEVKNWQSDYLRV